MIRYSVTGDEQALAELDEIWIPAEELEMSDLTERTEKIIKVSSYLPEDVMLVEENADSVVVSIQIEQPGVKNYEVSTSSITVNNLSENLQLSYGAVDFEIQVKGPAETLKVFSTAKKVSIDLKNYSVPGVYFVPVSIDLPDGCTMVSDVEIEIILDEKEEEQDQEDQEQE